LGKLRRRILVVDDDPDWREFLGVALEELGYDVCGVSDGAQALSRLSEGSFVAVLLDLNMPGMSGHEVARRLPPDAPAVIFVTSSTADQASAALADGPHYYLPKGAGPSELSLLLSALPTG
jgi:CheY-like chemotaxis protein